jgi:hypothetical protein
MTKKKFKKLTELEALKICRDLWQWIATTKLNRTGRYDRGLKKSLWPKWKQIHAKYGNFKYKCPCCEYVRQKNEMPQSGFDCFGDDCPLNGTCWIDGYGCVYSDSPFISWWESMRAYGPDTVCGEDQLKIRKDSALKIVNACNQAINKLTNK